MAAFSPIVFVIKRHPLELFELQGIFYAYMGSPRLSTSSLNPSNQGLMEYGFYGIVPESENPFVNMVFVQAIPSMRSAAERYDASVENGKKGGRPTEVPTDDIIKMKQDGMTNKQIADKLGLSEKTIENRITTYNKSHPYNPHNPPITPASTNGGTAPHNPHNLTVSVSDTVSKSVSYTDTETDTVSSMASDICPEEDGFEIVGDEEDTEQYPQTKEEWLSWIDLRESEPIEAWRTRLNRALGRTGGPTYIYGTNEDAVEKHKEVTRRFANEIFDKLNIKR